MILYPEISALVKLYAEEPRRGEVENAVREARVVAVSEIGYAEACSALARKEREGFFSTDKRNKSVEQLQRDYREVYLSRPVIGALIARAGELTRKHALRAYDAVHLATALVVLREEAHELEEDTSELGEPSPQKNDELQVMLMTFDGSLTKAVQQERLDYD